MADHKRSERSLDLLTRIAHFDKDRRAKVLRQMLTAHKNTQAARVEAEALRAEYIETEAQRINRGEMSAHDLKTSRAFLNHLKQLTDHQKAAELQSEDRVRTSLKALADSHVKSKTLEKILRKRVTQHQKSAEKRLERSAIPRGPSKLN